MHAHTSGAGVQPGDGGRQPHEHAAIKHWLERSGASPLKNLELQSGTLLPNHALRAAIREWQEQQHREAGADGHRLNDLDWLSASDALPASTSQVNEKG